MSNGLELLDCEREFTPLAASTRIRLSATVFEEGGASPTNIIRTNQDWRVLVEWQISGPLMRHFCGNWHVSVQLESVGPGEEYEFPTQAPDVIPMDPCGDGEYSHTIRVSAGDVEAKGPEGTLYIVSVTLGSTDPCGNAGHIYAYCTGEELHFVPGPVHSP